MKMIYVAWFTVTLLQAQSIEQIIELSVKHHPSLQAIEHRLSAIDDLIAESQNFSNPDVSMTLNDIQFDDPSNRSLEPMQYTAVSIQQQFPWFGKRHARKSFVEAQKSVMLDSYQSAKIKLAETIRITAYSIKELEARIKIIDRYKVLAKQNVALYTAHTSTQNKSHTNSMSASLMLSKVKIREQRYKTLLKSQKAKLKYLVQGRVSDISDSLQIKQPKPLGSYLSKYQNNPNYQRKVSQKALAVANQTLQDLSITPDPYVKVGFFNRREHPDYASVTVGISLPLYGSEKHKAEAARKEVLAAQSASVDFSASLESDIAVMHAKLTEAYEIYKIIQNESLPQLEHMFELSQSSIQKGGDLFAYTNLLEEKLALEEERISIMATYLRTQAQLNTLTGAL